MGAARPDLSELVPYHFHLSGSGIVSYGPVPSRPLSGQDRPQDPGRSLRSPPGARPVLYPIALPNIIKGNIILMLKYILIKNILKMGIESKSRRISSMIRACHRTKPNNTEQDSMKPTDTMTDAEFVHYLVEEYAWMPLKWMIKEGLEYALDYWHEHKDLDTMSEIVIPTSGDHDEEVAREYAGKILSEIENRGAIDASLDDVVQAVIDAI